MPRPSVLHAVAIAGVLVFAGPSVTSGADTEWTGAIDAAWATSGNWSAGAPAATDHAFLPSPLASNPAIVLPDAAVAANLTVASSLEVAGTLNVGYDGAGNRLAVSSGGVVSAANVCLGGVAASGSSLIQVFPAGDLSAPGTLVVGYAGDANTYNVLGTLSAGIITLGLESGADDNGVTVLGSGF